MSNNYGVYKEDESGEKLWVVTEMPLVLGSEDDAIDSYSYADAITVSQYLTNTEGAEFRFGRPNDRHGS